MKTAIVTGAGGFLGRALTAELLSTHAYQVIALTSQKEKMTEMFGKNPCFSVSEEIPQNVDLVFNCAFPSNADGIRMADGLAYIAGLFCRCREKGVKAMVNISTQSVYSQKREEPADENTTPNLESQYAVGKFAAEQMTDCMFSGIPHTNLRMASMIGPDSHQRITNRFVKKVMAGEDLHVVDSKQIYGFLDVRDAAKAIGMFGLTDPTRWQEVYNVGSDWGYTLRELAQCAVNVGKEFSFHSRVILDEDDGRIRNSTLISSRLQNLLQWKAETSLEETIRDTYRFYQEQAD